MQEYPVAGSAFTYIMVIFGELPAFITMGMLFVEYMLGMAAVARGFSQYLAQLVNQPSTFFTLNDGPGASGAPIDFMAFGVVLILTVALSFGVRESSLFLNTMTMFKLFLILFISIAGFARANGDYFTDDFTLPSKGPDGILQGAAFIFFAFVGFDAVCNAVEETRQPKRIPGAILGTVGIAAFAYMLLSVCLSLISPPFMLEGCYNSHDQSSCPAPAPPICLSACTYPIPQECVCGPGEEPAYAEAFAAAFSCAGLAWMRYIVAIAALTGILTSLLVGLYSVARLIMVAARSWLLPPQLALISPRTQTPLFAQLTSGFIISIMALFIDFTFLSQLVSFGTLFALWMVVNALLFRRYYPDVKLRYTQYGAVEASLGKTRRKVPGFLSSQKSRRILVWMHIIIINAFCLAFVIQYRVTLSFSDSPCIVGAADRWQRGSQKAHWVWAWMIGWFLASLSMFLVCPLEYEPPAWKIPAFLLPWLPSFAILLIFFSASSLQRNAFWIMAIYFVGLILVYLLFSMPLSYIRHYMIGPSSAEQVSVVEMIYYNGKWRTLDDASAATPSTNFSSFSVQHSYFGRQSKQRAAVAEDMRPGSSGSGGEEAPPAAGKSADGKDSNGATTMEPLEDTDTSHLRTSSSLQISPHVLPVLYEEPEKGT